MSRSQSGISPYCRPSRSYLVRNRGMLHWFLTTTGLTAFNQPLADQDLSGFYLYWSSQYRAISIITNINSMQTSCFLVLRFFQSLISITLFNGGGGSCFDFLSLQILTSSEQISSFLFNILSNACFRFRHVYNFVSSKPGVTLLLLN